MFRFHDKNVFEDSLAHFRCLFQQRVSSFFFMCLLNIGILTVFRWTWLGSTCFNNESQRAFRKINFFVKRINIDLLKTGRSILFQKELCQKPRWHENFFVKTSSISIGITFGKQTGNISNNSFAHPCSNDLQPVFQHNVKWCNCCSSNVEVFHRKRNNSFLDTYKSTLGSPWWRAIKCDEDKTRLTKELRVHSIHVWRFMCAVWKVLLVLVVILSLMSCVLSLGFTTQT